MLQGFKDFITRGNVIDLAVGVVIGAAFGNITTALVKEVIEPFIAGLVGQPKFDDVLAIQFGLLGDPATIRIGVLLTAVVNFLLVAAALYFLVVMPMNKIAERRAKEVAEAPTEEPSASPEAILLAEIRDALLANKQN